MPATQARSGRKTSWPEALLAVRTPVTRPRLSTNQRLAMIAASGTDTAPVARPLTTPQSRKSCHGSVIPVVRSDETAMTASAAPTTRRIPRRSTSAAAKGAPSPKQRRFSETASPIVS